jgi:hypothetical protein
VRFVLTCLCAVVAAASSAAPRELDLTGARIVIGANAAPMEVLAARELQRYLGRIGAGRCEIANAPASGRTSIVLGTPASSTAARAALSGKRLGEEGVVLRASLGRLVFAAETPCGVLWAAYGLLERLGAGFYLGGDALDGAGPPRLPLSKTRCTRSAPRTPRAAGTRVRSAGGCDCSRRVAPRVQRGAKIASQALRRPRLRA